MITGSSKTYDVLIAGGGPAGTSAAIHLAMRGARVLLAEQKSFPRAKLCGEFISPECLDHFERLGVMERMNEASGVELLETVFYSRGGNSVSVPSEWFGTGRGGALGLSRAEMDQRLLLRARAAGVDVLEEAQAGGLLMEGTRVCGVRLKVSGEVREYNARVTIDATGRARVLARRLEVDGRTHQHNGTSQNNRTRRAPLVAFKAHLEGARGEPGNCEIYFYRGGYGGLNQVEGGLSNLCFIAAARDVRACGSDPERVLREVVCSNSRAARTLEHARARSEWLSVALESFGRRELVPAEGLLAVGDAASFIDPFTGSGMLMALESGELAALTLARHLPSLLAGASFQTVAVDYEARYREQFNARLRVCSLLRRAAFVPRLAEGAILLLGASDRVRRRLARSTRRVGQPDGRGNIGPEERREKRDVV
ncbi:MAG TPA: NAD(P)/FAD-dependent oxidoreductase [Pyrinomonadaceae bacterium]|jgi:flavin-dependent dehydrogenase|nr:NAD(P)/FAD-dependent oxidoreductase [Pyrinomonadaceae bacterium]